MASRFSLPHIDISARATTQNYVGEGVGGGSSAVRIRAEHGTRIQAELQAAFTAADQKRPTDNRLERPTSSIVEVELRRGTRADTLDVKREGIRTGAAKVDEASRTIALHVPDHARPVLDQLLQEYLHGELTDVGQNPPNQAKVESIEAIREARLATLWTDQKATPEDTQTPNWWALWCFRDRESTIEDVCGRLDVRAANRDRRLYFPEVVVIPVLATRTTIELMMFATDAIAELRLANDTPSFFIDEVRGTARVGL
jgi:hypothetical protein